MNNPLRVGVIGCGIGRSHVRSFQSLPEQFQVVAVSDIDKAKAQALAAALHVPRVGTDLAEVCRMDDVDVIDLCTPSYLHYAEVLQVWAAGKHVICEKPVAGSLKEVDDLIVAEVQSGKCVMPIFQNRFRLGLQQLRLLVNEGIAGRAYLTTVETAWRRRAEYYAGWRGKWETELGGALVTLAVHAHDMLYYILGPAKTVFAHTATLVNPIETEDCVVASLEMADRSLGSLSVTTGSAAPITRLRFCFSNLTAESNAQAYLNTAEPWTFTGDTLEIEQRIRETLSHFVPLPAGFAGQFLRFHQAMQNQGDLPVTLADARASLELITAVYHSAETSRPVKLPIGKDHPKYARWRVEQTIQPSQ